MIERTKDYRIVKRLLNHNPVISTKFIYLLDGDNLWSLHEDQDALRIHADMTDKKGKDVIQSAKDAFEWVFKNTNYKKIVARIPKENRKACFIARQCMKLIKIDERHHYEVT